VADEAFFKFTCAFKEAYSVPTEILAALRRRNKRRHGRWTENELKMEGEIRRKINGNEFTSLWLREINAF